MAAILYAENASIDEQSQYYPAARFMLNVGTFLTGFGFYVVVYAFEVSLVPAAITVGLVSMLLAVEVLREAEGDPVRELVFAAAIGVVVAEARWALYFLPLESYLAGVFLLLVFYVGSGLIQHHIDDDLSGPVIMEFSVIAALGVVIVALGRIFETSVEIPPPYECHCDAIATARPKRSLTVRPDSRSAYVCRRRGPRFAHAPDGASRVASPRCARLAMTN